MLCYCKSMKFLTTGKCVKLKKKKSNYKKSTTGWISRILSLKKNLNKQTWGVLNTITHPCHPPQDQFHLTDPTFAPAPYANQFHPTTRTESSRIARTPNDQESLSKTQGLLCLPLRGHLIADTRTHTDTQMMIMNKQTPDNPNPNTLFWAIHA